VSARTVGATTIRVLAPTGQGHQYRSLVGLPFTNPSGGFIAVQDRQADIHEDHVGLKIRRPVNRRQTVIGRMRFVSAEGEQRGHHVSGVAIVIDDQNPERLSS
jgi:hypothetical protein